MEGALGINRYNFETCRPEDEDGDDENLDHDLLYFFCECDTKIEIWVADKGDLYFSRGWIQQQREILQ